MIDKVVVVVEFLWGVPLMVLMVGAGLYLTIKTGFFQFKNMRYVYRKTIGTIFGKNAKKLKVMVNLLLFKLLALY